MCKKIDKSNLIESAGGLCMPVIFHHYSGLLFTSFCRLPTEYIPSFKQVTSSALVAIQVAHSTEKASCIFDSVWTGVLKSQSLCPIHTNKRTASVLPTKEI